MIESLMEAVKNNPEIVVVIIAIIADFGAGVIPDHYLKYVGVIRRIAQKIMRNKGKASLVLAVLLLSVGCAHMQPSSVCDTEQESLICENIPQPENADILLQLANARLLKSETYSAEEALNFLDMCESFLTKDAVSYEGLAQWLVTKMDEYSLEVFVLSGYVSTIRSPQMISDYDRQLLLKHIEHQRNLIKTYQEKE